MTTNHPPMPELILASTSPWRRRILVEAGLPVRAVPPEVDEAAVCGTDPAQLVTTLALQKARAVAASRPQAWVIGADQVAFDPEAPHRIWGKPPDPEVHLERLRAMVGRRHTLITGLALVGPGITVCESERTEMWVRGDLTEAELRDYVATGEGSGCAGGYAAEGRGAFLFERVEGDWFNVLGLPLFRLITILRAQGWTFGGAP